MLCTTEKTRPRTSQSSCVKISELQEMVEDLWVISISCVKNAGEDLQFKLSTPGNKVQRWHILWLISHNPSSSP